MEAYWLFCDNFPLNNWGILPSIVKFTYNHIKIVRINYMSFKLNNDYYSSALYNEDVHPQFWFKSIDKLETWLRTLIIVLKKSPPSPKIIKATSQ